MNNALEEIIRKYSEELVVELNGIPDLQRKYDAIRKVLTKVARKTSEVCVNDIYESTQVGK